jgi:hypothetical protein
MSISENLKLTTLLVNIAEITLYLEVEYRNFLINSKFVYGNSLLANRNTF